MVINDQREWTVINDQRDERWSMTKRMNSDQWPKGWTVINDQRDEWWSETWQLYLAQWSKQDAHVSRDALRHEWLTILLRNYWPNAKWSDMLVKHGRANRKLDDFMFTAKEIHPVRWFTSEETSCPTISRCGHCQRTYRCPTPNVSRNSVLRSMGNCYVPRSMNSRNVTLFHMKSI